MKEDVYDSNFGRLNQKIITLMNNVRTPKHNGQHQDDQASLTSALEELSTALEELQLTEEEVRVQQNELVLTRQTLEEERQRYVDLFTFAPDCYLVTNLKGVIQEANQAAAKMLSVRQNYLSGKPLRLYIYSSSQKEFEAAIYSSSASPTTVYEWEAKVQPRHMPSVEVSITMTAIRDPAGNPTGLRWLLRDISKRKEAELNLLDLNAHLEQRVQERTTLIEQEVQLKDQALRREQAARAEAEALREIGTILNNTLEFSEVLELIIENVGRVVPNDATVIFLINGEYAVPVRCRGYTQCTKDAQNLARFQFLSASTFPFSKMLKTDKPVVIPNMRQMMRWMNVLEPPNRVKSFIGVPIHAYGEIIGFLGLSSMTADFYQHEHIHLLQAFAAQAAVAIQNANLYEKTRAVTVLEERQRLARDLHDAVTQTLFTSSLVAESVTQLVKIKPEELDIHLKQLVRLNRGALAEMRTLLLELRPAHLITINLPTELQQIINALRARKEIEVELVTDADVPMQPDVQVTFFRIAQEAFNNVSKHSRATQLDVTLISDSEKVVLTIEDNGRGFAQGGANGGMGLSNMRERAEAIGAVFELQSKPGQGTKLTVSYIKERG